MLFKVCKLQREFSVVALVSTFSAASQIVNAEITNHIQHANSTLHHGSIIVPQFIIEKSSLPVLGDDTSIGAW